MVVPNSYNMFNENLSMGISTNNLTWILEKQIISYIQDFGISSVPNTCKSQPVPLCRNENQGGRNKGFLSESSLVLFFANLFNYD